MRVLKISYESVKLSWPDSSRRSLRVKNALRSALQLSFKAMPNVQSWIQTNDYCRKFQMRQEVSIINYKIDTKTVMEI
jgi:hypothetical protein